MSMISYSQSSIFEKCPRQWYYQYLKKIPVESDMSYANAGTVVHKCLELHHNKVFDRIGPLNTQFNILWNKYKLDKSFLDNKKENYWNMVLNGIDHKVKITEQEMKIMFDDVIGYIDGVDEKNHTILDWKTSTRTKEKDEEYSKQLKFYSYLYNRKCNTIPKEATVYYLKYTGKKGKLTIIPTEKDVNAMDDWHLTQRMNMERIRQHKLIPERVKECNPWCPYKNICESDGVELSYSLILKNNYIYINGPISEILNRQLLKKFSYELKNAFFIKKNCPQANTNIVFWNNRNRTLPLGFYHGLIKTLNDYAKYKKKKLNLEIDDKRISNSKIEMPDKFLNNIILRDYQQQAVDEFLDKKIGVLQIATGSGKTEIATEIIRKTGVRTLFIVDKIELMNQTIERLKASLGIEIGQIGQSKNIKKDVTVATIQTLNKNISTYKKYLSTIEMVVYDECHKVAAKSYFRLSHSLINTNYRLGLSATSFRDDGNDMMINATTGYKIFDLSSDKLISEGWLMKPKIKFIKNYMPKENISKWEDECKTGLINETESYQKLYKKFIMENDYRNDLIKNIIDNNKEKKILILVKLVDHGKYLSEILNANYLHGSTPKEERAQMFKKFKKENSGVLISTISIFAEGIDLPDLNMIVNASGNRGEVKTIQVLGRVLRKLDGKEDAIYIDFIDESRFFRGASYSRRKILMKEGHDIDTIESTHL